MSVKAGMPRTQLLTPGVQGNEGRLRLELLGPESTFGTGSSKAEWAWMSWPSISAVSWESLWSGGMLRGGQAFRPLPFNYGGHEIFWFQEEGNNREWGLLKNIDFGIRCLDLNSCYQLVTWPGYSVEYSWPRTSLYFRFIICKMTIVMRSNGDLWCECSCSAWHFKVKREMRSWGWLAVLWGENWESHWLRLGQSKVLF